MPQHLTILARDVWTGDVLLPGDKVVTELQRLSPGDVAGGGSPPTMRITVGTPVHGTTPGLPIEIEDQINVRCPETEKVEVIRDRPMLDGMHMTQFDLDGKCHGRAHPALEQRLRAEGRMASG